MMARAPGVGPKLAARLVLELKDKAPAFGVGDLGGADRGGRVPPRSSRRPPKTRYSRWSAWATRARRPLAAVAKGFATLGPEAATAALIRVGLKELAQ